MPIRFHCFSCDARVKVPDGSEGKRMKCPRCGAVQRVPAADGETGEAVEGAAATRGGQAEPPEATADESANPLAALAAAADEEDDHAPSEPDDDDEEVAGDEPEYDAAGDDAGGEDAGPPVAAPAPPRPAAKPISLAGRPRPVPQPERAEGSGLAAAANIGLSSDPRSRASLEGAALEPARRRDAPPARRGPGSSGSAPQYTGLLVASWALRGFAALTALLTLIGSLLMLVGGLDAGVPGLGGGGAIGVFLYGAFTTIFTYASGEAFAALRDIARNSFRL